MAKVSLVVLCAIVVVVVVVVSVAVAESALDFSPPHRTAYSGGVRIPLGALK